MKVAPLISTKIMKLLVASSLWEEVLLEKGWVRLFLSLTRSGI